MSAKKKKAAVIGAGLAGCEAAWQLSRAGIAVDLYEMKPEKHSPAHKADTFAELVCSNSLKAERLNSAAGLLKAEMETFSSICVESAKQTRVPAGGALAVDRNAFSERITEAVTNAPGVRVIHKEVTELPADADVVILAVGPLASDGIAPVIRALAGDGLSFYDAAAPIVTAESVDMSEAFTQSRYDRGGEADYINCPMNKAQYEAFYEAIISAESAPLHSFGFQTNLKFGEQKRVFSMFPALKNAEFVRYGVMHRNTFIDSPRLLRADFSLRKDPHIYFAGQITGVEGYMESAASGILAGLNAARALNGQEPVVLPQTTMMGALSCYISDESVTHFQPMGANFGVLPPNPQKIRDKAERYMALATRAMADLTAYKESVNL